MPSEISRKGRRLFKCNICGFLYLEKPVAAECEKYCSAHGACSLEITKKAVAKG